MSVKPKMKPARGFALLSLVLFACNRSPAPPSPTPLAHTPTISTLQSANAGLTSVMIDGIPFIQQKPDFCGEACVAMALGKLGHPLDQDEVFARTGLHPALGRGAYTAELKVAVEALGFDPGPVWIKINPERAELEMGAELSAIHADLQKGIPSIVCMHYDESPSTTEHFRLIVGFDAKRDEIIYHEPAEENGGHRRMKRAQFFALWPLTYNKQSWTLVRFRLSPVNLSLATPQKVDGFSPADYAQKVMAIKNETRKLSGEFTVLVEPPFVVAGDGPEARVRAQAASTVRWASRLLKQDYFSKDPSRVLVVWLFKDNASYRKNAIALFHEVPDTPYGYYSSKHDALVMNIATGGGTLVHEIVHPFIEANFDSCPPWFNEGLGSLYEQAGDENGHIHGYTNWRLHGLQTAIAEGNVPSFKSLTAMNDGDFYGGDFGVHYAAARYLLYYLQEKGLLLRYYKEFYANREADPTGYNTLKSVLEENDMAAFKKRWETFVLGLSFP